MTAADHNQSINHVTSQNTDNNVSLYVAEDTEDPRTVTIDLTESTRVGGTVLWTATGNVADPSSGDFSKNSAPVITLKPSPDMDFTLTASAGSLQASIVIHVQDFDGNVDSPPESATGVFNIVRAGDAGKSMDVYVYLDVIATSGITVTGADPVGSGNYKCTIPAGSTSTQVNCTFNNPFDAAQSVMMHYLGACPTILGVGKYSFFSAGAVRTVQANGATTQVPSNTAGLRAALNAAINTNNPITELRITGHGDSTLIQLNGNPDIITISPDGTKILDNSGDITPLLQAAIAGNGTIRLQGCHTGNGAQCIAQQMSQILQGRTVTGGYRYLARFGKNTTVGKMSTYINGVKQ